MLPSFSKIINSLIKMCKIICNSVSKLQTIWIRKAYSVETFYTAVIGNISSGSISINVF